MGNRSKFAGVAAAAAGAVGIRAIAKRRRRGHAPVLHRIEGADAHAPGHEHLHLTATEWHEPAPPELRERPWTKHHHGLRHPDGS